MTLRQLIASDLARFTQTFVLRGQPFSKRRVFWESLIFKAGFQAVLLYRLSHRLHQRGWVYLPWFVSRVSLAITGAEIEFNAEIGPGLFIAHPVGIVVGRGTVIGGEATLFQGVTFGVKSWHPDEIRSFPRVGNQCYFFSGAAVLGGVTIGDECIIGAHAVVTTDMPGGSMALGVPAKIYADKGRDTILSWSGGSTPLVKQACVE
jgi:serine O-acetyltransferase